MVLLQVPELPLELLGKCSPVPRLQTLRGLWEAEGQLLKLQHDFPLICWNVRHAERSHEAPCLQVVKGKVVDIGERPLLWVAQHHPRVLHKAEPRVACARRMSHKGGLVVHRHDAQGEVVEIKGATDFGVIGDGEKRLRAHLLRELWDEDEVFGELGVGGFGPGVGVTRWMEGDRELLGESPGVGTSLPIFILLSESHHVRWAYHSGVVEQGMGDTTHSAGQLAVINQLSEQGSGGQPHTAQSDCSFCGTFVIEVKTAVDSGDHRERQSPQKM